MLYHLLVPLAKDHILFNVFRYLTFRSVMALISALVISLLIGPPLIQKLKEWQHGGETIREDTPERHRSKKGTPTMGGLVILAALIGSTLLWADLRSRYVWVVVLATAGFGLIGFWDDARKVKKRKGLTARTKFLMQLLLALGVLQIILWQPAANGWTPLLPIPFLKGWVLDLGWWWIPVATLVIVGASNAVNLTDGLDGLAIGPIIMAGGAFAVIAYLTGNFRAADYLRITNVKGAGEGMAFLVKRMRVAIGFSCYTCMLAQVFMGDVRLLARCESSGTR